MGFNKMIMCCLFFIFSFAVLRVNCEDQINTSELCKEFINILNNSDKNKMLKSQILLSRFGEAGFINEGKENIILFFAYLCVKGKLEKNEELFVLNVCEKSIKNLDFKEDKISMKDVLYYNVLQLFLGISFDLITDNEHHKKLQKILEDFKDISNKINKIVYNYFVSINKENYEEKLNLKDVKDFHQQLMKVAFISNWQVMSIKKLKEYNIVDKKEIDFDVETLINKIFSCSVKRYPIRMTPVIAD